jgi:hypothetical protein
VGGGRPGASTMHQAPVGSCRRRGGIRKRTPGLSGRPRGSPASQGDDSASSSTLRAVPGRATTVVSCPTEPQPNVIRGKVAARKWPDPAATSQGSQDCSIQDNQDFVYITDQDVYRCPAGELCRRPARFLDSVLGSDWHCPGLRLRPPGRRLAGATAPDVRSAVPYRTSHA